jgi:hypothetical protein
VVYYVEVDCDNKDEEEQEQGQEGRRKRMGTCL